MMPSMHTHSVGENLLLVKWSQQVQFPGNHTGKAKLWPQLFSRQFLKLTGAGWNADKAPGPPYPPLIPFLSFLPSSFCFGPIDYSSLFFFFFKLYNIVLVLPNIKMNPPQVYPRSPSWTLLPPPSPTLLLGRPSAPAPSIQYRASNLDWQLVSYMILYIFQCHSPKSSHPLPLPQSPKDCSIYQCLFCCLVHRVIVTIFLNSIYMR